MMIIERMINGIKHEITLTQSELESAYRLVETAFFKEDFISRCNDQRDRNLLPEVLIPITIEDKPELLDYAYEYYHKIHDCNLDYNSTLDSVIDETAKWFQLKFFK